MDLSYMSLDNLYDKFCLGHKHNSIKDKQGKQEHISMSSGLHNIVED